MTPPAILPKRNTLHFLIGTAALIVAIRIVLLIFAPHQDPSEARYAEISRKMVETHNWITPQHDYGVPFWAKPPLSMWMSATGIRMFGANEFGSRIFIFIAAIAVLALVAKMASREWSRQSGIAAASILMGMPLFFYCSAAVMTDLPLLLGTTLAMAGFHFCLKNQSKGWGYAFFIGLAIGLLAKGPLALVIALPPVAGWTLLTRNWRKAGTSVPWITGILLMLALSVPWYVAAEIRTPGFLNYFILGEHWHRFFDSSWKGDLYGKAHAASPGMIWVFLIAGSFPWCLGLLTLPLRGWKSSKAWMMENQAIGLYLLLWFVWPIAFFTPAKNVIATYPLPALPAAALLIAGLAHRRQTEAPAMRFDPLHPAFGSIGLALAAVALTVTLVFPQKSPKGSERALVRCFFTECEPGDRLIYYGHRKYSSEFYSAGTAANTRSADTLEAQLDLPGKLYAAMTPSAYLRLPYGIQHRFRLLGSFAGTPSLYRESSPDEHLEVSSN